MLNTASFDYLAAIEVHSFASLFVALAIVGYF